MRLTIIKFDRIDRINYIGVYMKKAVYNGGGIVCKKCHINKDILEFNKNCRGKYGVLSKCRECQHAIEKARYTSIKGSITTQNQRLKTRYGITLSDYHDMIEKQNKACAICGCIPVKLFIDHNHTTEKNRGLLCSQCNFLLGCAKEDTNILISAIEYLNTYSGISTVINQSNP